MRIPWDEPKRLASIDKHGLDFVDLTPDFFTDVETDPSMPVAGVGDGGILILTRKQGMHP